MLAEVASSFISSSRASGAPRAVAAARSLVLVSCRRSVGFAAGRGASPATRQRLAPPRCHSGNRRYLRDLRLADFGSGRGSAPGEPNMPSTPRCEHTQIEIRIARSASARRLIAAGMTRP